TRVRLYPLLRFARSAAFMVIVPIEPAGVAALGAHMLSQWTPYQSYRSTRVTPPRWPHEQPELTRPISFVLLSIIIVCSVRLPVPLTWSALALLLWNIFRVRRDISAVFSSARRLDRSSHHTTTPAQKTRSSVSQNGS